MKQRVAVIGTGISGLALSHFLHKDVDLHLFESAQRIGGHTATMDVIKDGEVYSIDTGFIVFNERTYPNFIGLLDELGVRSKPTDMSFSLSCRASGFEYGGSNVQTLFAQKRNLLSPGHWRMLRDIVKFNKTAVDDLEQARVDPNMCLGDYLARCAYGRRFKEFYLLPMASAIWSSGLAEVENMPLQFFVRFFANHGLLSVHDRPQWRVIEGGSNSYLEPLTEGYRDRIRLACPVTAVSRCADGVYIDSPVATGEKFDQVIFACHSDQAMALLSSELSHKEKDVLGSIGYSQNQVVLHTDTSLLPKNRKTWSSWNYLLGRNRNKAVLTYNMNILQGIESGSTFCVTMNDVDSIDPDLILGRYSYAHPEFSQKAIDAQGRWNEVNGCNRTWFCGAWWGNGFHEDGVVSALRVARAMQSTLRAKEMGQGSGSEPPDGDRLMMEIG